MGSGDGSGVATTPEQTRSQCTQRCKLSEDSIARLTSEITRRLGEGVTEQEQQTEGISTPITQELENRLSELEQRVESLQRPIQDQLLSNYGDLLNDTMNIESQIPIPESTPTPETGERDRSIPSPTPQRVEDQPRTPGVSQQPSLTPSPYESPCPKIDLCEPLRIWITQLMGQYQSNQMNPNINPQIRNIINQNEDREEDQQRNQRARVDAPMTVGPLDESVSFQEETTDSEA